MTEIITFPSIETRKKSPTDYKTLHSVGTTSYHDSDGEISPDLSDDKAAKQASEADSAAADSDEGSSGEETELRRIVSRLTEKKDSLDLNQKIQI